MSDRSEKKAQALRNTALALREAEENRLLEFFDRGVNRSLTFWKSPLVGLTEEEVHHYLYEHPELTKASQRMARSEEEMWNSGDTRKIHEAATPKMRQIDEQVRRNIFGRVSGKSRLMLEGEGEDIK